MKLRAVGSPGEHEVKPPAAPPLGTLAVRDGDAAWVFHRGEAWRVERVTSRPARAEHDFENALVAPMPGRVLAVFVEEGAVVAKGAALLVLEAMKMEHTISAPRDGTVRALLRKAGEMVARGDVLAEIA